MKKKKKAWITKPKHFCNSLHCCKLCYANKSVLNIKFPPTPRPYPTPKNFAFFIPVQSIKVRSNYTPYSRLKTPTICKNMPLPSLAKIFVLPPRGL